MSEQERMLRIAIQKSGRLFQKSKDLLNRSGISFEDSSRKLLCTSENFPIQILFVRDDDIPSYLKDGACDLGIVGYNEYYEQILAPALLKNKDSGLVSTIKPLGFGKCRLSIAIKESAAEYLKQDKHEVLRQVPKLKLATSYPNSLALYLKENKINAEIIEVSGSVEVTPLLGLTQGICDLVSTGSTLKSNGLVEVDKIFDSEAVLLKSEKTIWSESKNKTLDQLLKRIDGVLCAKNSKYLMMNAPKESIAEITQVIPGLEHPSVLPLHGSDTHVAIHVVISEEIFWESMEKLKAMGASSILVTPIEKILT